MQSTVKVAIVGRPNVGKSTLFNRLVGKRHAIIANEAGTTRDRVTQKVRINDYEILLIDTGGVAYGKNENIEADIQKQANLAIEEADIILFVVNLIEDLTVDDFTAAEILRKTKKPVVLIANKCDNAKIEENIYNIFELGFDEPIKISAIHKGGIDDLKYAITKKLKALKISKIEKKENNEKIINICFLGKPNAGKSSLVNALLGTEKVIVSNVPGTTRDMTDTEIEYENKKYNLIDTAGVRRPGKREGGIEKFSVLRCLSAIEKSDIVILLIDGNKGVTAQDTHIVQLALEENKGIVIAINKSDLLDEEKQNNLIYRIKRKFSFLPWVSVIFISALNKKNIFEIFNISDKIVEERKKRIPTGEFNSFMQKITYKHMPASTKYKKPKFMYGSQVEINPPKFTLFFKNSANLHFSYPRYLENEIRKEYGFFGTVIDIRIKKSVSENPYI